jgi:hypothetical protein
MKKFLIKYLQVFIFIFLSGQASAHYIYTSTKIATSFCAGSSINVPYTVSASYNSNNTFTAQLSDANGSFTSPLIIGTLTGKDSGTIKAVIPINTPAGTAYRIRVMGSSPYATGTTNGANITINKAPGDPSVFGNGFWNVSCYNGDMSVTPSTAVYYGNYTENNLSFDSRTRYPYTSSSNAVPSNANSLSGNMFSGCSSIGTTHTVSYKRTGFHCNYYQIDVPTLDDIGYLIINGVEVWKYIGCCVSHSNVWSGSLDSSSTIEFRYINAYSGSAGALTITTSTPVAIAATNGNCIQFNANWNAINNVQSYSLDIADDQLFTSILPAYNNLNVGNVTSYKVTGLTSGNTYYYRVRTNAACGQSVNSNTVKIDLAPTPGVSTWIGGVNTEWFNTANWCGPVPTSTTDAIIPAGATYMPVIHTSNNAAVRHIAINSNASLATNEKTLSVYGNWTNNGTYTSNKGGIVMLGNNASINGTGNNIFTSLQINIPSNGNGGGISGGTATGSIILNTPIAISGTLLLSNGLLSTSSTNSLNMNLGSTVNIGNSKSYVNGPMNYLVASTSSTTLTFPVGNNGDWRPAVVTVTHSSNVPVIYSTRLFSASALALGYTLGTGLSSVSAVHYWQIDRQAVPNFTNASVKLYYDINDQVSDYQNLTIANAPVTTWNKIGGAATANITGTIATTPLSTIGNFGKFTLANITGGTNPLPVEIIDFKASKNEGNVLIEWTSVSEKNNKFFTVEKSTDGTNYETIATVKGAGNSYSAINYKVTDNHITVGLSYYRLKQTDTDDKSTYTASVCLNYSPSSGVTLCQNPVAQGETMYLTLPKDDQGEILVVLRDVQGQEFYSKVILSTEDHQLIALKPNPELAPGIYVIIASSDNNIYSQKILVR